ncbi:MAG: sulfate adenylyltransferase [Alphaproteobacteria bacterium]|nr:sulfate adenylyltransferase [Alphaproteobacteria bacterium]
MSELVLTRPQYLELEKLSLGAFRPLTGFMNEDEFRGSVETMRLPGGAVFPLPVVLDVDGETAARLKGLPQVALVYDGEQVGELRPESVFTCDKSAVAEKVYGTTDSTHPGVAFFMAGGDHFIGGAVALTKRASFDFSGDELAPEETRALFAEKGWQTIVGFQTRNVPHRAHEYLQRIALEQVDGLFIQPLVGRKKKGDYTPQAILRGYRTLIGEFYPADKVAMGILSTYMRYAGPREAVFHALIRRNYGCTHFIIGRDHAGVGDYYGTYEAHEMTRRFDGDLGIEIMYLHGPYFCGRCDGIVTEQTCPHEKDLPDSVTHISGTDMRAMLLGGKEPDAHLMRPEVIAALQGTELFIEDDEI